MVATPSAAGSRTHMAEAGTDSNGGVAALAPPPVTKNIVHRFWNRICSFTKTTMLWLSTGGTVAMLIYQLLYSWQKLPNFLSFLYPDPGAQAWLVGVVMLVGYVVSKVPHIFGQEPGDAVGIVREFVLNEINLVLAVIFLTASYFGARHAPNAVGISVMLLILFVGMMIGQLVQVVVLSRRTWTDSSGAAASV